MAEPIISRPQTGEAASAGWTSASDRDVAVPDSAFELFSATGHHRRRRLLPQEVIVPCAVIAKTPADMEMLFGFNDLCPWDQVDNQLLLLRLATSLDRIPDSTDIVEVC